jgi:hypothetical protein
MQDKKTEERGYKSIYLLIEDPKYVNELGRNITVLNYNLI